MRYIIFYVFLFIPYIILSQNLDQHVIATSGDYTKTENNTLSWTIGETLIETAKKDSFILTQGFQQGNLSVITLINKNEIIYSLKVYPNPVKNKLTIETTDKSLNYQLINTKVYLILN